MIANLSAYREIRTRGQQYKASAYPTGVGGVAVADGIVTFTASPGDPGSARVLRSEVVGNYGTRFGRQRMQAELRVPKFWAHNSAIMGWSAVADAGDAGIHNSPLSLQLDGDMASLWLRCDPLASSVADAPATRIGQRRLVSGRWYLLDIDVNFSWQADGFVHAGLTDLDAALMERFGDAVGPNCYNDVQPPYPFFGTYWWEPTGDPMRLLVRRFEVT